MNTVVSLRANTLLKKEMKVSLTVADFKLQMFNGILCKDLSYFYLKCLPILLRRGNLRKI